MKKSLVIVESPTKAKTIEDLEAIRASAAHSTTGVVIGGGLLGLEAAKALKDLGLETHVIEYAPRLMAVQLDDGGGRVLRNKIESLGVRVHAQHDVTARTLARDRGRRALALRL